MPYAGYLCGCCGWAERGRRQDQPNDPPSGGNFPKLIRPLDTGKLHKILKHILIVTPRLQIIDVGEPCGFGWHFTQAQEVRSAQKPAGRRQQSGKIRVLLHPILLLIKYFINSTRSWLIAPFRHAL